MFFAQAAMFTFGAWRVEQGAMTYVDFSSDLNIKLIGFLLF
jgi:hypothetical protein